MEMVFDLYELSHGDDSTCESFDQERVQLGGLQLGRVILLQEIQFKDQFYWMGIVLFDVLLDCYCFIGCFIGCLLDGYQFIGCFIG